MKKITINNADSILEKNRSLVKCKDDPTVVYVYMGHPIDSYMGSEDKRKLALHSLTTGDMHNVSIADELYMVESESDVLHDLKNVKDKDSYAGVLERIQKVFK